MSNFRFRNNSESGEHENSKAPPFKARPLNSKVGSFNKLGVFLNLMKLYFWNEFVS